MPAPSIARSLAVLSWSLALEAFTQPSYQILLDVAPPYSNKALAVIPSTDDGAIYVFEDGVDSYVFRRFDANGVHEWSWRVESPAFINEWAGSANPADEWEGLWWPFTSDGNGGLIYCYSGATTRSADGAGLDTNITSTTVMRMNADGVVTAFDELENALIMPADTIWPLLGGQHPNMTVMPNGDLIVFEAHYSIWSSVSALQGTRLSPSGEVIWARWYHIPGDPITQGPSGDMGQFQQLIPDVGGGFYLVDGFVKRVLRFDADGHCFWAKGYAYDGTLLPYSHSPALAVARTAMS